MGDIMLQGKNEIKLEQNVDFNLSRNQKNVTCRRE